VWKGPGQLSGNLRQAWGGTAWAGFRVAWAGDGAAQGVERKPRPVCIYPSNRLSTTKHPLDQNKAPGRQAVRQPPAAAPARAGFRVAWFSFRVTWPAGPSRRGGQPTCRGRPSAGDTPRGLPAAQGGSPGRERLGDRASVGVVNRRPISPIRPAVFGPGYAKQKPSPLRPPTAPRAPKGAAEGRERP
jgi:hypothetical protein